jgi:hypothetical protein
MTLRIPTFENSDIEQWFNASYEPCVKEHLLERYPKDAELESVLNEVVFLHNLTNDEINAIERLIDELWPDVPNTRTRYEFDLWCDLTFPIMLQKDARSGLFRAMA